MTLLLALTLVAAVGNTRSNDEFQTTSKQYVVVMFSLGPAWEQAKPFNEQKGSTEHSKNLQRLRAEKRIAVGARYAEKGMVILEAASEDEARAQFASDAMVRDSVFIMEVNTFSVFYKGCVE